MDHLTTNIRNTGAFLRKFMFSLKLLLSVCVLCMTAGCANRAMNYAVASWQDQQVSEVISEWGNPSEELKIEGKQLLIWNTYDGRLVPPDKTSSSPPPNTGSCVRLLQADKKGRIVEGTWDGDNCPGWLSGWARW